MPTRLCERATRLNGRIIAERVIRPRNPRGTADCPRWRGKFARDDCAPRGLVLRARYAPASALDKVPADGEQRALGKGSMGMYIKLWRAKSAPPRGEGRRLCRRVAASS